MAVYRLLPPAVRTHVSAAVLRAEAKSFQFRKTADWQRGEETGANRNSLMAATAHQCSTVGVNIFAFVRGRFGLAEGARQYTRALLAAECPIWLCDVGDGLGVPHDMNDTSLECLIGQGERHRINLVFVNPDYLEPVMASHMPSIADGSSYTIGVWFWEAEGFPLEWRPALEMVDEVMVASAHLEQALREVTDKPVLRVPLPVGGLVSSDLKRTDFGLRENAFIFLSMFDFSSYFQRKNPVSVIQAFRAAFPGSVYDVQLLLKSINGHRYPEELSALREAAAGDERIILRDEIIEKRHVHALQRCVDSFVSLHRAEGFGMALAECMWLEKPVIATGWSGNMEFMTEENSFPVRYELAQIAPGGYAHGAGQRWAEPNVEHAADLMRQLVDDPEHARKVGKKAARDVRSSLSSQTAAAVIMRRVNEIGSNAFRHAGDGFHGASR